MASALTRRRRAAVLTAAGAAVLSIGGVLGSVMVKSPAQAVADSGPPRASVITAEVEKRRMVRTIVFRGDFGTGRQTEITPTEVASTGGGDEGAAAVRSKLVVTKVLARPGSKAHAADPLVEVSGRPVFVLPGKLPGYRDLLPGTTGEDVAQLQDALAASGLGHGSDTEGYFGPGTKSAVTSLYQRMGYQPPVTGAQTAQAVTQAKATLDEKQQRLDELTRAATTPAPTPAAGTGATGTSTGGTAAGGETVATGTTGTGGETTATDTGGGTGGGATAPESRDRDASRSAETSAQTLAKARTERDDARKAYDDAVAHDGVMVPLSEMVFVSGLPARVTSLPLAVGDEVEGPVAVLTSGGPALTGYLDPLVGDRAKAGMKVDVTSESLGLTAHGTIASIGEKVTPGDKTAEETGTAGAPDRGQNAGANVNGGVPYLPVKITPDRPWNEGFSGRNVMIKITSSLTDTAVLSVPQAAPRTGADARTTVTVLDATGAERQVQVTAGVSADGMVQVTPAHGEELHEKDRVVIGR